jgi:RNA polymerase sigma-70 factor (ECF subfamily)
MATDEARLVCLGRAGDQEAFAALVQRYERQIYSLAYRMLGNPDDAFDLSQECFIRAYKNLPRTHEALNFSAWLHRIAANACLDVLRRRTRIRWLAWDAPRHERLLVSRPSEDPERMAVAGETAVEVRRVLERMSARNRLALVLREYQGLSTQEIGEAMNLSRTAVKTMLFRAREEFRRKYIEELGEPSSGH